MARRKLTASEKKAMQAARVTARDEKEAALKALAENAQFQNYKLWKAVDPDVIAGIEKAIAKARDAAKQAKIAELEKELAELKGE